MEVKLTKEQEELVEKFGVVLERMGVAPAPARVNALLTISDETELTFDQIRETLGLSKSATSNAINNLLTLGQIDYKTKHGDRKRYFYSKLGQWKSKFKTDITGLNSYNDIIKEIYVARSKETKEFNGQLKELTEFTEYFIKESIGLIDKWNSKVK